jgi:hypothetical protein
MCANFSRAAGYARIQTAIDTEGLGRWLGASMFLQHSSHSRYADAELFTRNRDGSFWRHAFV